ncbi:MAG: two component transcriptional regulator, LuxR family [Verrucomicrobiaceae bacterium]|nr:two component transcriptional regulator, LuxR family [Verrucomicrobiaceae bacterium]
MDNSPVKPLSPSGSQTASTLGTVMIVDDAPANLALLSDALIEQGYRVLVATDGYSALEQLNYIKPDLILLDGMMPGIDGFETCRQIKQNPQTAAIPVLFMTALGELDDLLHGFDEGAVDYIVKPFRNEEVLARVGAHIGQARISSRVEEVLSVSGLSVLALNGICEITWVTPAAAALLHNVNRTAATEKLALPAVLLDFVSSYIRADNHSAPMRFRLGELSAKISACVYSADTKGNVDTAEYLLFLHKANDEPSFDSLRDDLGLTAREAEVLMWITRGKTNRDIGEILGSSPRTVNKHLEHIFEKLGVSTRSAAVSVALQSMK